MTGQPHRVARPDVGPLAAGGAGPAWAVLGVVWGAVGVAGVVWTAGSVASLAARGDNDGMAFGFAFAEAMATGGPSAVWPSTPVWLLWTAIAVGLLVLLVAAVAVGRAVVGHRRGRQGLAEPGDVAHLTGRAAVRRAGELRRGLDRRPDPSELGLVLGRHDVRGGQVLRSSWEDVLLAVMAPRAGKTTALAVPAVLDAPGPVVATSNKPDLWAATAGPRSDVGRVWVFDPQQIAKLPASWWWDPLAGVDSIATADRLAGHFCTEITNAGGGGDKFWAAAARDLLTAFLLAAASSGRSLRDVYRWVSDPTSHEPAALLRRAGHHDAAHSLEGRIAGAPQTRDGIYETARTATACLRDPAVLAWVTPSPADTADDDRTTFDPRTFVASGDTLQLLSADGAGTARPLVAALVDATFVAATAAAVAQGGRLDPPMVAVLDEAANICCIADLPELYSHLGSRGIVPLTILQSYRQGTRVWGEAGMDALWSAATIKLIGAGIDDARLAGDLSRLVGDRETTTATVSSGHRSWSTRRDPILPPDAIRAMPRGSALLLATGARIARLRLLPWYADRRRARAIDLAVTDAQQGLRDRALAESTRS